jgi:hypothetical protein
MDELPVPTKSVVLVLNVTLATSIIGVVTVKVSVTSRAKESVDVSELVNVNFGVNVAIICYLLINFLFIKTVC